MKDGIIKGNGNSRYLKSVADFLTQYPTYEAFAAALTAGTLPVDLNGINEDGWQQIGDLLNKGNLFADPTAAVFADEAAAVPNDGMYYLAMALGAMEQDKGVLLVYASTPEGEPVAGQTVTISGSFGEIPLSGSGSVMVIAEPGSYTVSFDDTGFYETDAVEKTADVVSGKITVCHFSCSLKSSGIIAIKQSTTLVVPALFPPIDLFAVGGGGSGAAVLAYSASGNMAGGGAGAYTTTVKGIDLSGKKLTITIGAGAEGVQVTTQTTNNQKNGNSGGKTTIKVNDELILEANGGTGGKCNSLGSSSGIYGGIGGSGGGADRSTTVDENHNGGSDGSNGSGTNAGTGQGSTTKSFGESTGILVSGGGAGAAGQTNHAKGKGGDGGGGDGAAGSVRKGNDGTNYGAGGGAIASSYADTTGATSGAGHDGVVMIRWGVSV